MKKLVFLFSGVMLAVAASGCGLFAGPPHENVPALVVPSPSHASAAWMHVDAQTRTVDLKVIAGYASHGFNLDGTANGAMDVRVPEGWHVVIDFTNASGLNNSLAVVSSGRSTRQAFPGAGTPPLQEGIAEGQTRTLKFVAARPGTYRLASLVPGHEASGMWAHFTVTAAGAPSLRL